jgi:hypothetical protein
MLSSVCWVSRGAPQSVPVWEGQELEEALPEAEDDGVEEAQEIEGGGEEREVHTEMDMGDDETKRVMREFRMDSYDDDDADQAVFGACCVPLPKHAYDAHYHTQF